MTIKLLSVTLPIALLAAGGACKDKAKKGNERARPAPTANPQAGPSKPSPQPDTRPLLADGIPLDRRPGPRHEQRVKAADKLEKCLLGGDGPADDCFSETARGQLVDATPPVTASGKAEVAEWRKSGFGLGLKNVQSKPILTMVKGGHAVLLGHLQGIATGDFLGVKVSDKPVSLLFGLSVRYDRSGKIIEVQAHLDQLSALGQVGGTQLEHRPAGPAPTGEPVRALSSGYGSEAKNLQVLQQVTTDLDQHEAKLMLRYYQPKAFVMRLWQSADAIGHEAIGKSYDAEFVGSSNSVHTVKWEWVAMDHVAMLIERSGTSTGSLFQNSEPTNRSYTLQELHIMRIRDGKLDRHWILTNGLGLATQIGALAPGKKSPKKSSK